MNLPLHPIRTGLLLAVAGFSGPSLPAQGDGVQFIPRLSLGSAAVVDAPALLTAMAQTPLGALMRDPDARAAFDLAGTRLRERVDRWRAIAELAARADAGILDDGDLVALQLSRLDLRDVRSIGVYATLGDGQRFPQATALLQPTLRAEGRLTQMFEQLVAALDASPQLQRDPETAQKISGYPAHVFIPVADEDQFSLAGMLPRGTWLAHLPGQFIFGQGKPEAAGAVGEAPQPQPGCFYGADVSEYMKMIMGVGGGIPAEAQRILESFGLDNINRVEWRLRVAGDRVQEELSAHKRDGDWNGLLAGLVDAAAPVPAQPLPDGALLQLRCGLDAGRVADLIEVIGEAADAGPMLEELTTGLRKAWNGGLVLGVCEPARGGFVPRLYLSCGIRDADACRALMHRFVDGDDVQSKEVEYAGMSCTQIRIAGAPATVQPTWSIVDGVLHVAESARSMRDLAQARADDAPAAMDIGAAPLPVTSGALLPALELRFDGAAIYRATHELWRPLFATAVGLTDADAQPLLTADEMPDTDAICELLGKGRGVLALDGDELIFAVSGVVGGPHMCALLSLMPTVLSGGMSADWQRDARRLAQRLARQRLAAVQEALEAYAAKNGRRPSSLGELLAARLLQDPEALLVPGDEQPEAVMHDGKQVALSSYRYLPTAPAMILDGETHNIVLIQLEPMQYDRLFVTDEGGFVTPYGLSSVPIDQLPGVTGK